MLLKNLGFDKGDERSVYIGFYSSRIAWALTSLILLIWSVQGFLATGGLSAQFGVFCISQVVFWVSYLYYRKKLGS